MRKFLLLFCFSFLLLNMNIVNAEEPFYFGWDTGDTLIGDYSKGLKNDYGSEIPFVTIKDNNYQFNHGYVTTRIEIDSTKESIISFIKYFGKNGNIIKEKEFENTIFTSIKSCGTSLYAVAFKIVGDKTDIWLYELDTGLNVVREKNISNYLYIYNEDGSVENSSDILSIALLPKIIGYDAISVVDNNIALLYSTTELLILDKNFENVRKEKFSINLLKKYFKNMGLASKHIIDYNEEMNKATSNEFPDELLFSTSGSGSYIASSGVKLNINRDLDFEHGFVFPKSYTQNDENIYEFLEIDAKLGLFDSNYNLLWEKVSTDYMAYLNTQVIHDYIVSIGLKISVSEDSYSDFVDDGKVEESSLYGYMNALTSANTFEIYSDILIFDIQGNLIQIISSDSLYLGLFPSESGFITTNIKGINELLKQETNVRPSMEGIMRQAHTFDKDFNITMTNEVWNIKNNIKTNVIGEGTIFVVDSELAGNEVVFNVKPKEGYDISVIKVTDVNGNVIEFTDNTFTMPSADVTIEVVFINNSETIDGILVSLLLCVISIFSIMYFRKKISN